MAAEEDNFDIDIYGEGEGDGEGEAGQNEEEYYDEDEHTFTIDAEPPPIKRSESNRDSVTNDIPTGPRSKPPEKPETTPVPSQGVKRKGSPSDRSVDSGATTALMLSDLHWWITEDDIRDWVNQAEVEDELRDITFSEHKVNGKSKGQVYLSFDSPEASSAAKHKIDDLTEGPNKTRKFTIAFSNGSHNPFKTSPKDAPARAKEERSIRGGSSAYNMGRGDFGDRGGYRGRGRGYDRGGYGGQGYNRNLSGPVGGYNNRGGFQGNMGMMNNNFNNFNRGAMMGNNMRGNMGGMPGGRGGMNMMQMGNMGMMNPMMAGMGMSGVHLV